MRLKLHSGGASFRCAAQKREFPGALGRVLRRPVWMPVPGFALRPGSDDMADILPTGQRAVPTAAVKLGPEFRYSELRAALAASSAF